ncbi:MAG: GDSL-type esterase/lipase family protein [Microcoleaceae cyanobacterium]
MKPTKLSKIFLISTIILFIILGASILVNIILFNRAKQYYWELNQTRLDPIGLNKYPITSQTTINPDTTRVVFFGDSRAASWISPDVDQYEFINRGIGSQTSTQTLQRFAAHINPLKPNIIIVQIGVNDLKTIALFPQRKASIIENCKSNIQQIVEASNQLGAVVILTTIFPVGEVPLERKLFWSEEVATAINEVNAYISTLATEKVIILDTFAILADNQGMVLSKYKTDELHLNPEGYTALNQELIKLLNSVQ